MGTTIGNRIRIERELVGMSQAQLARTILQRREQVCRWEKGLDRPSLPAQRLIALVLGISLDRLVNGIPRAPRGKTPPIVIPPELLAAA